MCILGSKNKALNNNFDAWITAICRQWSINPYMRGGVLKKGVHAPFKNKNKRIIFSLSHTNLKARIFPVYFLKTCSSPALYQEYYLCSVAPVASCTRPAAVMIFIRRLKYHFVIFCFPHPITCWKT